MTTYRAVHDGIEVFTAETDTYEGCKVFPKECLDPAEGTVILYVDDTVIGVQRPLADRPTEG